MGSSERTGRPDVVYKSDGLVGPDTSSYKLGWGVPMRRELDISKETRRRPVPF